MRLFDTDRFAPYGLALLRIGVGMVFFMHGYQKLFLMGPSGVAGFFGSLGIPAPVLAANLVTGVELLGGLSLILGLGTRFVTVPLAIDMLTAIATVHAKNGFFLPNGVEFTLTLLLANVALFTTGPGALAIDHLIGRRAAPATAAAGRAAYDGSYD